MKYVDTQGPDSQNASLMFPWRKQMSSFEFLLFVYVWECNLIATFLPSFFYLWNFKYIPPCILSSSCFLFTSIAFLCKSMYSNMYTHICIYWIHAYWNIYIYIYVHICSNIHIFLNINCWVNIFYVCFYGYSFSSGQVIVMNFCREGKSLIFFYLHSCL